MKAKDLAEQLLQNPNLDVVILDTEYNPEVATGLQLGKVVGSCFSSCAELDSLKQSIENFEKLDLAEEFVKTKAERYCSLEEYIENSNRSHAQRVAFLERAEAAPFVLSLI